MQLNKIFFQYRFRVYSTTQHDKKYNLIVCKAVLRIIDIHVDILIYCRLKKIEHIIFYFALSGAISALHIVHIARSKRAIEISSAHNWTDRKATVRILVHALTLPRKHMKSTIGGIMGSIK